jgi:heme A synthase
MVFQIQYYNIDQEKTESEWTQKVNRILAKIMILMFIVTIVFLFLTQRYQKRTIQFIDILSIFEVF